jgi:alanyl-tRNA synthetase
MPRPGFAHATAPALAHARARISPVTRRRVVVMRARVDGAAKSLVTQLRLALGSTASRASSIASARRRVRALGTATNDQSTGTRANPNAEGKDNSGRGIRRRFLEFYEARGHSRQPSASLVPEDPTVLLTIAGMLQFKPVFMGQREREMPRATTTQKCVRTNDIENVGVTARHHTFFEMLGNFSFGDYFKREACEWAWELATKEFGLNPERVWVSVFREDDEAFGIWRDVVGVPESRIKRMDEKDNFWAAGPTGPCGPCSELYYDFHPERGLDGADLDDDSRFIEFYNLVFMELNRDADGGIKPLKNKNIDTGMGLERMAQILQGVSNNYETDLIRPIIDKAASMAGLDYASCSATQKQQLKVIGDHTRAVTYMISDGVFASNIGRGYIVRRLLRRVVRNGRLLGIKPADGQSAFTPSIAEVAISMSEECDPQVVKNTARILAELEREELSFQKTLGRGEEMLAELIEKAKDSKSGLSGKDAFTLYDTYGFPLDITTDVASEAGIAVDLEGFEKAMAEQRSMSQAAHQTVDVTAGNALAQVADELGAMSEFIGYDNISSDVSNVLAIVSGGESVEEASEGARVDVVLDVTPFYAESGGQVGDNGFLHSADGAVLEVTDVQKAGGGRIIVHSATVVKGSIKKGSQVSANVDENARRRARNNHTATHLLQSALKKVLGDDVSQAGSLCGFDRLRFDFNCPKAVTEAQLLEVETVVNGWISQSADLTAEEMPIAAAKEKGATMMFGEKYGDVVRVVDVPGISMELCGGTHVSNTAEIGGFKIISEAGIASGIRRIEAVAGAGVVELLQQRDAVVKQLASTLRVPPEEIASRVSGMQKDLVAAQKLAESLRGELAVAKANALVSEARAVGESKVLVARLDGVDPGALKVAAENLATQLGDGAAVILGSANGDNVGLVALFDTKVQKDGGLKAGQVLGAAAKRCGGGGGGKPGFAQAGGRDATQLDAALNEALQTLTTALDK